MVNIVLFGAPGCGKGTQAQRLKEHYGIDHVSTGEVIRDEIRRGTELGQSMEVMELQMAQSAELEVFSGSLFQRQELLKEHQRQELALSETHAGEMIALLGEILGEIEGKEGGSGEMVLTEQQKNELKKRLAEVGLSLSKLKISREELDKKKQTDFDILGMNASKWEEFFNN